MMAVPPAQNKRPQVGRPSNGKRKRRRRKSGVVAVAQGGGRQGINSGHPAHLRVVKYPTCEKAPQLTWFGEETNVAPDSAQLMYNQKAIMQRLVAIDQELKKITSALKSCRPHNFVYESYKSAFVAHIREEWLTWMCQHVQKHLSDDDALTSARIGGVPYSVRSLLSAVIVNQRT